MEGRLIHLVYCTGLLIALNGCGIQDSINRTMADTEAMKEGMDTSLTLQEDLANTTKQAMHKQTLTLALNGLFDPNNTGTLNPPSRMVPYGKAFAEEATADEIASFSALYIGDARNRTDGLLSLHDRQVDLTAVGIVSGYVSTGKFEEILDKQINHHGEYEDYIYTMILTRYDFIRDFLFLPTLQKQSILNKSNVIDCGNYFLSLKEIAHLRYADRIRIDLPAIFYSQVLDTTEIDRLGSYAISVFNAQLPTSVLHDPEVIAAMKNFQ